MADNQIFIEVKMDDGSYRKALVQLEKDSKDSSEAAGVSLLKLGAIIGATEVVFEKMFEAATEGFRELQHLFAEGIHLAMETEQSIRGLNLSLAQQGNYSQDASEHLQHFIEGLEKTTAVSDHVIANGAALLASLGKLSGEGLDRATKSALDLAAGLQKGPEETFQMLARAAEGNFNAFHRLGIKFVETGNHAADFARLMDIVQSRFGGMAEGRLNTFSGAIEKLGISFDNFLKQIGFAFTRSVILKEIVKALGDFFDKLAEGVSGLSKTGNVLDTIIIKALQLASVFTQYVLPVGELVYKSFKFAFDAVTLMLQQVVVDVVKVMSAVVGTVAKFIPSLQPFAQGLSDFKESSTEVLTGMEEQTKSSFDQIGNYDFSANAETLRQSWVDTTQALVQTHAGAMEEIHNNEQKLAEGGMFQSFVAGFTDGVFTMEQAVEKMRQVAKQMGTTVRQTMANGLSQGFAAVGKALVQGQNIFAAFGTVLLQTFGQILTSLGAQLIGAGLALSLSIVTLGQGLTMIAAGAGVSIAGGVLQALAGGGSEGASGGGGASAAGLGAGGGVAAASSPGGTAEAVTQQLEPPKPQTSVVVNVHGNILNSRDTAIEIADVMRKNFDLNGVTLAGAAAT